MKIRKSEGKIAKVVMKISCIALGLLFCALLTVGAYDAVIPETVSCFSKGEVPAYLGTTFETDGAAESCGSLVNLSHGQYKLFGAIPVKSVTVAKLEDVKVHVGGVPFGIKFSTKGAMVVGFENETENTAFKSGLRLYDTIIRINGKEVLSSNDLSNAVENSSGKEIELVCLRAGKEISIKVKPDFVKNENKYSLGIWLKDSGAGIGTVTFALPDGSFGGLGHGICDSETGELTPMSSGSVLGVTVNGIIKGQKGAPGELKGYFNSSKIGALWTNTDCGVFGTLVDLPDAIKEKTYSLGLRNELKEGSATLVCTLDDNVRREYTIEISNINRNASGNKCFTVKVTDERLLSATGGIVQGMSGSPIIQNGKLVGAVTHVLVNDPTTGYGIFIENMLAQMSTPQQRAA